MGLLKVLAKNPECAQEIDKNNGIVIIRNTMKLHPNIKSIWEDGFNTYALMANEPNIAN